MRRHLAPDGRAPVACSGLFPVVRNDLIQHRCFRMAQRILERSVLHAPAVSDTHCMPFNLLILPVVDIMFGDFSTLVMDQMVNQAAKVHYMSGGKWKVPMVMRATMGATRRSAAQHSQSLHAWFCHIPGLKVAMPSTPYDAKGLMKTAIRDDNPVVIFEDKMMYKLKGPVPAEEYTIPFGVADVKRVGSDITIVATRDRKST